MGKDKNNEGISFNIGPGVPPAAVFIVTAVVTQGMADVPRFFVLLLAYGVASNSSAKALGTLVEKIKAITTRKKIDDTKELDYGKRSESEQKPL